MKKIGLYVLSFILIASCSTDGENGKTIIDDEGNIETIDTSVNKKSVGESANDLLSGADFTELVVEIFYVEDYKPTTASIENLETFLSERLYKPMGIQVNLTQIASPGKDVYSITDIRELEDDIRTVYNDEGTIAVFGIYIDGEYAENTENGTVLGVAYRNTSFVIFENTVQEFSGKPFAPSTAVLESTVVNHEFGHLLGLVNAGTTPQSDHQDVEHGRHCTIENCLMYWTAETGEGLLSSISGGTIPDLDDQCIKDLQANGGK